MANRLFKGDFKTLEQGIVKLFGTVTLGSSGAIASSSCKGFSVAKTSAETGRYTVTLSDTYTELYTVMVNITTSADTAYTSAKGLVALLRNVSVNDSTPTFDIQFVDADGSAADAEVEDSAVLRIEITLKNSTAY